MAGAVKHLGRTVAPSTAGCAARGAPPEANPAPPGQRQLGRLTGGRRPSTAARTGSPAGAGTTV